MKKDVRYVALFLLIITCLVGCSDADSDFSPGSADSRIAGTWRLYERRFLKDSVYSVRIDTTVQTRDTSFYATRLYSAAKPQTISFSTNGALSASGTDMTYYAPIRYFRLDSTFYGLGLNLFITTNRATQSFRQTVEFRRDTLVLLPQCSQGVCDQNYYLKFLRAR